MDSILLHMCCGVCASSVIQRLMRGNFKVVGFFYNPNIHPEAEYKRRLDAAKDLSQILGFELIEGTYDKDSWLKSTQALRNEPEGARRCALCFRIRLKETHRKSLELNIPFFTTTLSVSPHKDASVINKIGKGLDNSAFLGQDFKEGDGFKEAVEFSKRYNLYRQNYCGCAYSIYNPLRVGLADLK